MVMSYFRCGMLFLASIIFKNCFSMLLNIINGDSFHPNHLLSVHRPLPLFQLSISLHLCKNWVSPSQASLSSAERHCSRRVTVRPPSFHVPLALMWIMWGHSNTQLIWVELICVLWAVYWHQKHCALSCPLGLLMWVIFLKMLVKVKSVSLNHWLIIVRAVDVAVN